MFQEDILKMTNEIQKFKNKFESKYEKNINILVSDKSDVILNIKTWEDEIHAMKEAHQIKTVEIQAKGLLDIADPMFCQAYEELKKNIRNYVRTVPEDIKRQAYTQPITSLVWDKE